MGRGGRKNNELKKNQKNKMKAGLENYIKKTQK